MPRGNKTKEIFRFERIILKSNQKYFAFPNLFEGFNHVEFHISIKWSPQDENQLTKAEIFVTKLLFLFLFNFPPRVHTGLKFFCVSFAQSQEIPFFKLRNYANRAKHKSLRGYLNAPLDEKVRRNLVAV